MTTNLTEAAALFQVAAGTTKATPEEGKKIAKAILSDFGGANGYLERRNIKIEQNELFAKGENSMLEFLDYIGIDGKNAYVNIDLKPLKIIPKYLRNITQRFMERDERPTVDAIDSRSLEQKQEAKDEAEFRMRKAAEIAQLQDAAGIPLEDETAYTPTDEEDLEFYFEEEWQDQRAVAFQKHIYDVLMDNSYPEIKRKLLRTFVKHGFVMLKVYKDGANRSKIRICKNQNAVYGYSERDDFSDCTVFGERRKFKVSQFRTQFPDISEEKIFEFYKKSNKNIHTPWEEKYNQSIYRDYDDATIDVLEFEVITTEDEEWLMKRTKNNKTLVFRSENESYYSGEKQPKKRRREVVYCGAYVEGADEIVYWQLQKNMIVPHWNMGECMSSYVVVMPHNENMEPEPLLDGVVTPIRGMIMAHLKLQQLIAKLKPDGIAVDIDGLVDIDLGDGKKSPLQLQAVYDQTGIYYYKGFGEDGETRQGSPIQPLNTNARVVSDIQTLITAYNFYQEQLQSVLGTNDYVDGQGVNPKLGLGVMSNQVNASNRNTEFIYDAFITALENTAKRIAVLEFYKIVNGDAYAGVPKEEMMSMSFDLTISMLPTEQERQYLDALVNNAVSAGLVTMEEAFRVRNMARKNVRQAEKYLGVYERKRQEQAAASKQQDIMGNMQVQQQSNQLANQMQMQLEQMKGNMKIQQVEQQNKGAEVNDFAKFMRDMALEAFKTGKDMPPLLTQMFEQYLQGAAMRNQLGMIDKQMEAQAVQQQMMQQQEQ